MAIVLLNTTIAIKLTTPLFEHFFNLGPKYISLHISTPMGSSEGERDILNY
jgi:hypothetical protein